MRKFLHTLLISSISLITTSCDDAIEYSVVGGIYGVVTDGSTTSPIKGASVVLTPTGTSTVTSSDGTFDFQGLEAQQYNVAVTASGYTSYSRTVTAVAGKDVSCDINLTQEAQVVEFTVSTESLSFGVNDSENTFTITNTSSSSSNSWSVSDIDVDWMSVSPASGTMGVGGSSVVKVTIYRDKITEDVTSYIIVNATGGSKQIQVSVTAAKDAPILGVDQATLDFGETTTSKYISISNTGTQSLTFLVENIPDWMSVSPTTATIDAGSSKSIMISVDRDKMSSSQSVDLLISSDGGDKSVNISVTKPVAVAVLNVDKSSLDFGETSSTMTFTISNTGTDALSYTITNSASWLSLSSSSGSVDVNKSQVITLTIDRTKAYGDVEETLSISSNGGSATVTVKAYEPIDYGTASSPYKDLTIVISSAYMLSNVLYLEYTATYTGTQTASYIGVSFSQTSANDNLGNIYSASNIKVSLGGDSYTSNTSISTIQPNTVFKGGIKISNIDTTATSLTSVILDTTYNDGSGSSYEDIIFYNIPIIR